MDKLKYLAILLFIVGWLIFLSFIDPEEHVVYPKCVFKGLTGMDCPGCGSSRCAYDMVHLQFKAAFQHNPLAFIAIPSLLVYAVLGLFNVKLNWLQQVTPTFIQKYFSLILLVTILLFWILRNVLTH
jgi:hypothetical protein